VKKRVLPILAALAPYLMVCVMLCVIRFTPERLQSVSPLHFFCLILLLGPILGFVCLVSGLRSASPALVAKWNLFVKLAHIPFYILIFLLTALALPLFAPFFFLLDAAVLFLSSGFGIAAALRARNEGHIATGWAVLHILLHCFFVLDVISAFLIYKKLR